MRRFDTVVLLVRGIRFRLGGSVATLVVAVLAAAAATLGPLYSATAQDSLVRQRLADTPPYSTGLVADTDLASQPLPPGAVVRAATDALEDPRWDRFWGPSSLTVQAAAVHVPLPGQLVPGLTATVSWRKSMCVSVRLARGRCPVDDVAVGAPHEAMVSRATADRYALRPGARVPLGLGAATPDGNRALLVGVYDAGTGTAPAWVFDAPAQAVASTGDEPTVLDEILVDRGLVTGSRVGARVTGFRPLRTGVVHARDTETLGRLAGDQLPPTSDGPLVDVTSGLPGVVAQIGADRRLVERAAIAVTAQLALLALFVLYLVVAAGAEGRGAEVALAKLRGMSAGATAVFGLAEPVFLVAVAVPVGAVLALACDAGLADGLSPGSEVRVDGSTLAATLAALVGGAAAVVLAARRLLGTPVLGQLRRTGGRRAALGRSIALDSAAVVAAGAGLYELRTGSSDLVGLSTPSLLSLAGGLLVVRAVPPACRLWAARTRRSRRLVAFLASRSLGRRPAASRLTVLLAVAVALSVFAVDGYAVAREVRDSSARASVGAERVVHVAASGPGQLLAAVRAADPTGRQAMAVEQSTATTRPALLAVDTPRLAATTTWDPRWGGTSADALAAGLRPPGPAPVVVQGALAVSYDNAASGPAADLALAAELVDDRGERVFAELGRVAPRARGTLRAALPDRCRAAGCRLIDWQFSRPRVGAGLTGTVADPETAAPPGVDGNVVLGRLADGRGPLRLDGPDHWRYGLAETDRLDPGRAPDVAVAPGAAGGFTVVLDSASVAPFTVAATDVPVAVPALVGRDAGLLGSTAVPGGASSPGLGGPTLLVAPVPGGGTLPRVGTVASMVDLESLSVVDPKAVSTTDDQVWFAPDADFAAVLARLAPLGVRPVAGDPVRPVAVETVADRRAELGRSGTAIGLRIYLLAALAALLLALGALLTAGLVAARRRSYEVAALLSLGARRSVVVRAGATEQLVPVLLGTFVGLAGGLVAAHLALPVLGSVTAGAPQAPALVAWVPVGLVAAGVAVLAALVAALVSARVAAQGGPERLREVQA